MSTNSVESKKLGIRATIKKGDGLLNRILRKAYFAVDRAELPIPRIICKILWLTVRFLVNAYYFGKSKFWVTPLYRGLCFTVGKAFRAGTFVPFVEGSGRILVGDNVKFYGKQTFLFASIKQEIPAIDIGDDATIGHNVVFDIAGKLVIGNHCMVASGVMFQDCSGHSIVAELRKADVPPMEKDVRDITIGNNVWIGTGVYILSGAVIGNNCVIAANTLVSKRIPDNSLVYAPGPKVIEIRNISKVI